MIGIAITTRNRPELLEYTLMHFQGFKPYGRFVIVVCDDHSDPQNALENRSHCDKYGATYIYSDSRLGIAKNKNVGIQALRSIDVDYYFLFDDDCMPKAVGWYNPFINLARTHNIQHSMHLVEAKPEVVIVFEDKDIKVWSECGGYCLFFTKQAMDALRGMDNRFGIYGYEHAELTKRAHRLGFCGNYPRPYLSPANACNYIYSLDMDRGWHQEISPLGPFESKFQSSLENERHLLDGYIKENWDIYLKT